MGRKKRPIYAVVAADSRSPRDGRFLEDLGRYEPLQSSGTSEINRDRIIYWLETGAQPTDTVKSILSDQGVMLTLHMRRKGAEQADIDKAVSEFLERRTALKSAKKTVTAEERRLQVLRDEEKKAEAEAAEFAKKKAEADAASAAAAAAAQKTAAEDRLKAAEEARLEQSAANEAQATDDASSTASAESAAPEASAEPEVATDEAQAEAATVETDGETASDDVVEETAKG